VSGRFALGSFASSAKSYLFPSAHSLYCPGFLASKIARLHSESPKSPITSSLEPPSTVPFLSLLQPSLGRPPLQNLPPTKSNLSSPPVSTQTRSLSPKPRISSALKYLYDRSLTQAEIQFLETNEPSFCRFVETMSYVAEVNDKIEELEADRGAATSSERESSSSSIGGRKSRDLVASASPAKNGEGGEGIESHRRRFGGVP